MKSWALSQILVLTTRSRHPAACHPSCCQDPLLSPTQTLPPYSLRVIRFLSISRLRSLPAHLATKLSTHSCGEGGAKRGTLGSWANMECVESRAMTCQTVSGCQEAKGFFVDQRPVPEEWEMDPGRPLGRGKTPQLPKVSLGADGAGKALNRPGLGLGMELRRAGCWMFSLGPSLPASMPTDILQLSLKPDPGRQVNRAKVMGASRPGSLEGLPLKQLAQKVVGGGDLPRLWIHYS